MSLPCGHPDTPLHNGLHLSCPYPDCQESWGTSYIQCFTDSQVVAEYERTCREPGQYRWEPVTKPGSI